MPQVLACSLQLIVDDGSNVVEEIARNRLRPALKDDSAEVPLERRQIGGRCAYVASNNSLQRFKIQYKRFLVPASGAAVDCWARDCWWEGYIHSAHKDRVTVRFRGAPYSLEIKCDQVPDTN